MSPSETAHDPLYLPFAEAPAGAESVVVPMRDGTGLHADVYLPTSARSARVPAVLIRAPYGVRESFMLLPEIARYLAQRGMATVVQDVRGKFRSGGERVPFLHEVSDGYDTLEWLSTQRWCNGAVGMYGESYYGFTQWAAVASGHPALKAIAPIVTGSELPMWHARSGTVPFLAAPVGWFAGTWESESIFVREESDVLDFTRVPILDVLAAEFPHARDLVSDLVVAPSSDLLARTYPTGSPAPRVSIPVLHRGGWWDNIKGSQLDDWRTVQHAPARDQQWLEMAAMDHYSEPYGVGASVTANDDLDPQAVVERITGSAAAFLEHHLQVRDGGRRPRVRVEVANGGWLDADRWPLPGTEELVWHLSGASAALASSDGGALSTGADTDRTTVAWTHRPDDLVPSLTVSDFHILPVLPDENAVHARNDVATFTSEPLAHDVLIAGDVKALLTIRSSCVSVPVLAGLHRVSSGVATLVTEGSRAVVVDGGEAVVEVDLGAVAIGVPAGDRLRLSVSVSRFPRYLPPSGTVESSWLAADRRPFDVALVVGGGSAAQLRVPVLPQSPGWSR